MSFPRRHRRRSFAVKITAMIDVTTLTDLITQFRNTTASNSVSPETVGSILQKIVDILATAGTQANLDIINKWHEALKTAAPALTALSQGTADRNHIYLAARSVNLYTGAQTTLSPIQIQQATTERAGAMRAQQVVDLNAARRDVADIKKQITTINSLLGVGTADNLYKASQISCQVVNGSLHLLGAQTLTAAGYVPYLFRRVRKRNPYKNKFATDEQRAAKKYCPKKKGWGLYGSMYAVRLNGTEIQFSTNGHDNLCTAAGGWSVAPSTLVTRHTDRHGNVSFGLGRSSVSLTDPKNPKKQRMIRLVFGIGLAKPIYPGTAAITPANLVSSLATFTIIYDPGSKSWAFGP